MSTPSSLNPYDQWQRQHARASEWVWQLSQGLPLAALQSWLNTQPGTAPTCPLHLRVHHPHKQTSPSASPLIDAYRSAAPGLNTFYLGQNLRLSLFIGPDTPQWPILPQQAAYLDLDEQFLPASPTVDPNPRTSPAWYAPAPPSTVTQVCIIGAGIAGASTAYALAIQGIKVTVLDQGPMAGAASGNRQGLVYAKISPHMTLQSQLLLAGYGFTLRLLQQLLPNKHDWDDCGVLHLDVTSQEQKRNQALANWPYPELFTPLSRAAASAQAGIPLPSGGLFWPQGGWVHPPSLVAKLLAHPNIIVHERSRVDKIEYLQNAWQLTLENHDRPSHSGSHLVLCQGHLAQQFLDLNALPLTPIRGQVTHALQPPSLPPLNIALSGHSYVSPPWQQQYCFGASFQAGVTHTELTSQETTHNHEALSLLCTPLADALTDVTPTSGKAAIRCDSHDHLPLVGTLGPRTALRLNYPELAIDKTRSSEVPCTLYPNLYLNTAHGTRGLATAPLCGFAIAHELLGHSSTLSEPLRQALHPHRFWIREIIRRQTLS